MAQRKAPTASSSASPKPSIVESVDDGSVLVVAPRPDMVERIRAAVGAQAVGMQVVADIDDVPDALQHHPVRLVINVGESDGLIPMLRADAPAAQAIFLDATPDVDRSITAFRAGYVDYLAADELADDAAFADRVSAALKKQHHIARTERRLDRLRAAVRKLNLSRREVGKRVDVLCNDLISAYTDLAHQMDTVRLRQEFGALLEDADDLEQLLCHTMDWVLKRMGHCNIAIYLTSDDGNSELGAYMKYTIAGDPPLTDALAAGLVRQTQHRGYIHADGTSLPALLTPDELPIMQGQTVLSVDCQYLAESLATVICFRDARKPFNADDRAALECAAGPFAQVLTTLVSDRGDEDWSDEGWPHVDGGYDDDDEGWPDEGKPRDDDRHAADWWKNGDDAPY
ncbi:MAG: hypothetical protein AAF743_01760 [Planctomycetota bacterium]